jgi:hypothetical protein
MLMNCAGGIWHSIRSRAKANAKADLYSANIRFLATRKLVRYKLSD